MLRDATSVDPFTEFMREAEPRIRRALTAAFGSEIAREATAEAVSYGWQVALTGGSPAGGVMQTGAVGEGVVYVTSNDGFRSDSSVFALDVNDGSILWQRVLATPGFGAIALANGVLYVPTTGMGQEGKGILYALNAETGEELWSDQVEGEIGGGLSISNGVLFVGSGFGDPPNMAPAKNGGVTAFGLP